ncbi:hypothetical protein [Vibrio sp. B181a]|uniref:hypothetical protein n=1 Tax=Vibrio sp. B181a TaxID=2835906 RepID=UPI002555814C|nr:hypothetical protein [Vibrio sp. B181a]MDK9774442.1 hypothetical protein [Vibrio sp. B181a]
MMRTKDARLRIANTILAQLSGNRFIVMTGAKQFVAIEQGLMFTLPARLAKLGINKVRVELAASDTYTIEVLQESGVYCVQLEQTFEDLTGVYTRF